MTQNKTPLQQAIELMQPLAETSAAAMLCIHHLQSLLPVEREAIEAAYREGHEYCADAVSCYGGELYIPELNKDYFIQTYGI